MPDEPIEQPGGEEPPVAPQPPVEPPASDTAAPAAVAARSSCPCRAHLLPVVVIAAAAAISFLPAFRVGFVGDDVDYVVENTGVHSLSHVPSYFSAAYWNPPEAGLRRAYRPIVEITLAVDHAIWGLKAAGFRLTNLLFHVLVAVALYAVTFELTRHRLAALVAGVLFAAHPVHAEAVNVIKNRGDMLSTLFCLLSWLAFIGMVERVHARQASGRRAVSGARGVVVAVLFFILALFSKEAAIALPVLLLIYTAALVPVGWRSWAAAQTLVMWVALWGYLALSLAAIEKFSPIRYVGVEEGGRALLVVKSLGRYLRLLLAPTSRSAVHPFDPLTDAPAWEGWPVIVTLAGLGLLVLVCVVIFRRHRLAAFALAWLPIALLPVSNVVPVGRPWIAEHRLYLPAVGFCLFLGAIVAGLARRRIGKEPSFGGAYRVVVVVLALVAALYVVRSATRSWSWQKALGATPATTQQAHEPPASIHMARQ